VTNGGRQNVPFDTVVEDNAGMADLAEATYLGP
jgi:hypothetical protein